jgi:phosphopantetheine adenylyltransferase
VAQYFRTRAKEVELEKIQEQREKAGLMPLEIKEEDKVGAKLSQELLTQQVKALKKVTKKKKKEVGSYQEFIRKKVLFQKAS